MSPLTVLSALVVFLVVGYLVLRFFGSRSTWK